MQLGFQQAETMVEGRWGLSCPLTSRCSDLGSGTYGRRGRGVRGGMEVAAVLASATHLAVGLSLP